MRSWTRLKQTYWEVGRPEKPGGIDGCLGERSPIPEHTASVICWCYVARSDRQTDTQQDRVQGKCWWRFSPLGEQHSAAGVKLLSASEETQGRRSCLKLSRQSQLCEESSPYNEIITQLILKNILHFNKKKALCQEIVIYKPWSVFACIWSKNVFRRGLRGLYNNIYLQKKKIVSTGCLCTR